MIEGEELKCGLRNCRSGCEGKKSICYFKLKRRGYFLYHKRKSIIVKIKTFMDPLIILRNPSNDLTPPDNRRE